MSIDLERQVIIYINNNENETEFSKVLKNTSKNSLLLFEINFKKLTKQKNSNEESIKVLLDRIQEIMSETNSTFYDVVLVIENSTKQLLLSLKRIAFYLVEIDSDYIIGEKLVLNILISYFSKNSDNKIIENRKNEYDENRIHGCVLVESNKIDYEYLVQEIESYHFSIH